MVDLLWLFIWQDLSSIYNKSNIESLVDVVLVISWLNLVIKLFVIILIYL